MKKIFFHFLLVFSFTALRAQDLIVTNKGDSINCFIRDITRRDIIFAINQNDRIVTTKLAQWEVKSYQKNFYQTRVVPVEKIVQMATYNKWRLGVSGAFGYLLAPVPDMPGFEKYYRELKKGYSLGAEAGWFKNKYIGFGAKYSVFKTSNEMDNIYVVYPNGQTKKGILRDDVSLHYFAPVFFLRGSFGKRLPFISDFSIGYVGYKNKAVYVDPYTITGNTLGMSVGFRFEFDIDYSLTLGFGGNINTGIIDRIQVDDGKRKLQYQLEENELQNISRIDLSVTLSFKK